MLQFSLRSLLVAVAAVAVGTAALLNANTWWASGLFAIEIFLLFFAAVEVIFRRGQNAFWIGYLLAGSLYLLLLIPSTTTELGSQFRALPTTNLIVWWYSLLPDSKKAPYLAIPPGSATGQGNTPVGMYPMPDGTYRSGVPIASSGPGGGMPGMPMMGMAGMSNPSYVDPNLFIQIGHAIFAISLAWLGGTVAHWRYGKRSRKDAQG